MVDETVAVRFVGDASGVELLRLCDLRARMGARLHRYERLDFTLYLVPRSGSGLHTVDFVDHACRPGRLLRVAPGRVHRFERDGTLEADLLLVHPRATTQRATRTEAVLDLGDADDRALRSLLGLVEHALARGDVPAVRHLVDAWVALVDHLPGPREAPPSASYAARARAFEALVEEHQASWRRVEDYAGALACSMKTLVRACVATVGRTPRQVLEDRVMLEARRLLVLDDRPVEAVGRALGYGQASNFTAAFRRVLGVTPREFRRQRLEPREVSPPAPAA